MCYFNPQYHATSIAYCADRRATHAPANILLLRTCEGLVVKRAADEAGARIMQSDNPDWPDAPLPEAAEIIGRVRWMGCGLE